MSRPKVFFQDIDLHFVEGVSIHSRYSFPSGHTLTAFSLATLLVFLFPKQKMLAIVAFICSLLVGISRIYLAQHFFKDVYAGALMGTLFTAVLFIWMEKQRWYNSIPLDKGLLKQH